MTRIYEDLNRIIHGVVWDSPEPTGAIYTNCGWSPLFSQTHEVNGRWIDVVTCRYCLLEGLLATPEERAKKEIP